MAGLVPAMTRLKWFCVPSRCAAGPGRKIAKTTPCKVEWTPARSTLAVLRPGQEKNPGQESNLTSSRSRRRMSAVGGRPEVVGGGSNPTRLTLNGHHRRGYRTDKDFMRYPLIISASVPIAVQAIPSVDIGSQRQGTHRSRVSEPSIPDRDYPYRIFCDQPTQVRVLSEIFGTFLAI